MQGTRYVPQMEPRSGEKRRIKYKQIWGMETFTRNSQTDVVFFRRSSNTRSKSNQDTDGSTNIREAFLIHKILFLPLFGTSAADLAALFNDAIMELVIQGSRAYELLLETQSPGVGFTGATSLVTLGEPTGKKASSLTGENGIRVAGGTPYSVEFKFPRVRKLAQDVGARVCLQVIADVPAEGN